MGVRCRHCEVVKRGALVRGLCSKCYYILEIRELYPVLSAAESYRRNQGVGIPLGTVAQDDPQHAEKLDGSAPLRTLAEQPTEFMPGTEGKVSVLEMRAALGVELFHPLDALPEREADLDLPISCLRNGAGSYGEERSARRGRAVKSLVDSIVGINPLQSNQF